MNLIDTHSHLFLEEFTDDLPQVIQCARHVGVTHIFLPNIDSTTIAPMLAVCDAYPNYCFPMIGLHPTSVNANYMEELTIVEEALAASNRYVAIGETGLDLYWDKTYMDEQLVALDKQIHWALEYDLPIVLHCREAFDLLYKVLLPYRETSLRGIFHSFTGTVEEASRIMEFPHFLMGINGVITFKKSNLSDTLANIPAERIVLETDAPYLAPVPHRGKRNESAFLADTLLRVAESYRLSVEEMADITSANALKLFLKQG
ncbi:MAG: TatD family hydrolase [Prevotellaceae bacterium]|jgi:TatD DNase family protein|nr:TatD family hydrolase [Prevotellaceae bacterium]